MSVKQFANLAVAVAPPRTPIPDSRGTPEGPTGQAAPDLAIDIAKLVSLFLSFDRVRGRSFLTNASLTPDEIARGYLESLDELTAFQTAIRKFFRAVCGANLLILQNQDAGESEPLRAAGNACETAMLQRLGVSLDGSPDVLPAISNILSATVAALPAPQLFAHLQSALTIAVRQFSEDFVALLHPLSGRPQRSRHHALFEKTEVPTVPSTATQTILAGTDRDPAHAGLGRDLD